MLTKDIPSQPLDDKAKLRAKRAAYMREYGRRKGATPVRGVLITCARCGIKTEKQHRSHDWCRPCVKPAQLERRTRKRASEGSEPVGTVKDCKNCGARFAKQHKRQLHCPPCSELSDKDALPANRKRQSAYQSARNKERRRTDPAFAISCRVSVGINGSLKGGKAGRKWETLVGYTLPQLMSHLERQFLPGMNWDNRSRWDIDHIVPLSAHNFETTDDPEFAAAWALTNLRPLWKIANIKKSGRRTLLL